MTAMFPTNLPTASKPNGESFHLQRSKCVDAFALAEASVQALLNGAKLKCTTEPFKQKIGMVKKLPANPQYSKARKLEVDNLASELESLLALRADIVHSPMQIALIDGTAFACFVNAKEAGENAPFARLLGYNALKAVARQVLQIANKLAETKINPASSPPPPSPGAAGDP